MEFIRYDYDSLFSQEPQRNQAAPGHNRPALVPGLSAAGRPGRDLSRRQMWLDGKPSKHG